jgi:hypothetical protein
MSIFLVDWMVFFGIDENINAHGPAPHSGQRRFVARKRSEKDA